MTKPITLVDGDSLELWCQLAPQGEFTRVREDGSEYTQLLDEAAFQRLITAFDKAGREILLDYEHRSETTDDSKAAGWIKGLRVKDGLLEARIRFTPGGASAVHSRDLRYLSPAWELGTDHRPTGLGSVGLTNTPYFKQLRPVLNKAGGADQQTQNKGKAVKELALLFGLAEDASEADILAAVKKYKDDMDGKAVSAEAEQVAAANSAKIGDKAAFIKAYFQNKEVALATLNAAKAPAAVVNKADARTPSFSAASLGGTKALNRDEFKRELAKQPPGKRQEWHDEHIGSVVE